MSRRLAAVGVVPAGKHGTHALRHARAVSLLRGGVSLKVIGDVLGHRSERSTAAYLEARHRRSALCGTRPAGEGGAMKYDDIDRFLNTLALALKSRYTYVTTLRAFRAFARAAHAPG